MHPVRCCRYLCPCPCLRRRGRARARGNGRWYRRRWRHGCRCRCRSAARRPGASPVRVACHRISVRPRVRRRVHCRLFAWGVPTEIGNSSHVIRDRVASLGARRHMDVRHTSRASLEQDQPLLALGADPPMRLAVSAACGVCPQAVCLLGRHRRLGLLRVMVREAHDSVREQRRGSQRVRIEPKLPSGPRRS